MNPNPLGYFHHVPLGTRGGMTHRPAAVTVIAWIGVALASLILILLCIGLSSGPSVTSALRRPNEQPAAAIGFLFGFLVRWSFYILMLAGCIGLLLSLPSSRRLVVVSAYAWVVLTVLEIVVLTYGLTASQAMRPYQPTLPTSGEVVFLFAVACAFGIAFPFATLAILRRPAAVAYFRALGDTPVPLPPGRIEKYAAWAVLVAVGVIALHELAQLFMWLTLDPRRSPGLGTYENLPYSFGGIRGTITPLLLLHIATRAAMITAAVLTLRRQPAARILMIIACFASIILETSRVQTPYRTTGGPPLSILEWFILNARPVAQALRAAFPYALVLLAFLSPTPTADPEVPADALIIP